jgi:hypothetical protein
VRRRQSNALRTLLAAAVPVGLVLSAAVVWQSTSAAFTATIDNAGNSWQAGTVALSTTTTALFSAGSAGTPGPEGRLKPLVPGAHCIQVDYTGNLPADIRLYVTTPGTNSTSLDPYLEMKVEQGTNGTVDENCNGFSTSATVIYPTAADGVGATRTMQQLKGKADWDSGIPVGNSVPEGTHLTFKITYLVKDDNGAQGKKSDATFTWEARNT